MSVNQGTSTDMSTISGEDSGSALVFVEDSGAQNFNLSDEYRYQSGGGMMAQECPKDISMADDKVKELQIYFANPSQLVKSFAPEAKYTGEIDGKINSDLKNIAKLIESALSELLESDKVKGIILNTNPEDIEDALSQADEYRKTTKVAMTRDERIYQLSKILISANLG